MKKESGVRGGQDLLDRLCEQHQEILVAEETIVQRRQEMAQLLKDLKQTNQSGHSHCRAELEVLRMGNDCLQQIVAERDQQLAELNQRLAATAAPQPRQDARLAEVNSLREQLKEKDALIEELRAAHQEPVASASSSNQDQDYEAELTEFRRQLEADRQELNQEIQQLRSRNAELNDTVREAELQLSRERAQLARERVELDRMREEIRQQVESTQRDAEVRERLAGVDKLKEEVAGRQRPGGGGPGIVGPSVRKSGSSLTTWKALLSGQTAND
jgi:hypothetical protein